MIVLGLREIQTLKGIAAGMTNPQIAEKHGVATRTIDHYRTTMLNKMGANNRAHAVSLAYEWGILKAGAK